MTRNRPRPRINGRQFVILLIFLTVAGIAVSHWLMLHYQLCGPPNPQPCDIPNGSPLNACPDAPIGYPCRPEPWTIATLALPLSSAAYLIYLAIKRKYKS